MGLGFRAFGVSGFKAFRVAVFLCYWSLQCVLGFRVSGF